MDTTQLIKKHYPLINKWTFLPWVPLFCAPAILLVFTALFGRSETLGIAIAIISCVSMMAISVLGSIMPILARLEVRSRMEVVNMIKDVPIIFVYGQGLVREDKVRLAIMANDTNGSKTFEKKVNEMRAYIGDELKRAHHKLVSLEAMKPCVIAYFEKKVTFRWMSVLFRVAGYQKGRKIVCDVDITEDLIRLYHHELTHIILSVTFPAGTSHSSTKEHHEIMGKVGL